MLMLMLMIGSVCCPEVGSGSSPGDNHGGDPECFRSLRLRGGEWGRLTSPGFPDPYPGAADCRWLVTAESPKATVLLRIDSLDLEADARCSLDYLQVYSGTTPLAPTAGPPLCGSLRGRLLRSNSSEVLLVFHSDPTHEEAGFVVYPFTQTAGCPELLTTESGTLRSPGFPDPYPDAADCWTLIRVSGGRKVSLTFDSVDLERGDGDCAFDYVRAYDGETPGSGSLLGVVCSPSGPLMLTSSSNSLLVHFHSDPSVSGKGYSATYTSRPNERAPEGGCLWRTEGQGGVVASPNHPSAYPSHSRCSVWLVGGEGTRVHLVFEALQMEMEPGCPYDFLQIEEPRGADGDMEVLGRFCGNEGEPGNLTSTRNELRIAFQADDFGEFSGFRLRYSFEKEAPAASQEEEEEEEELEFAEVPPNATLELGSSHTLRCTTRTPAQIRWLKGGELLEGDTPLPGLRRLPDDSLWIRSMEASLSGTYSCVARNRGGGSEITARARLDVRKDSSPTCGIVFRRRPSDASLSEGDFFHLECLAAGRQVRISWRKDGRPLETDGGGHVTLLTGGLLYVEGTNASDAGIYECVATEEGGACERSASAWVQVKRRIGVEDVCGRSSATNPPPVTKIIGGRDAPRGAHPWQAMLWEPSLGPFCGGTLLNERWIATAAHCFVNYRNLRWERVEVRLGAHDRTEQGEVRTSVADASSVVVHPAYDRNTFDNDLALIRLRDHVAFTERVAPACLAEDGDLLLRPGRTGTVVGWGKLKENGPAPRRLQEIRLPVVDQEICRASTNYTVTRNMFCAGYAQETVGDACQGDSGGPFLVTRGGKWYLVGVVSWGEGCGAPDKYGFYTRLPNYASWIRAIIKT